MQPALQNSNNFKNEALRISLNASDDRLKVIDAKRFKNHLKINPSIHNHKSPMLVP